MKGGHLKWSIQGQSPFGNRRFKQKHQQMKIVGIAKKTSCNKYYWYPYPINIRLLLLPWYIHLVCSGLLMSKSLLWSLRDYDAQTNRRPTSTSTSTSEAVAQVKSRHTTGGASPIAGSLLLILSTGCFLASIYEFGLTMRQRLHFLHPLSSHYPLSCW